MRRKSRIGSGGFTFNAARLNIFQQEAFELAAVFWAVGVNTATATVVGGAGLGKFGGSPLPFFLRELQALGFGFKPGNVGGLQFNVGENDAVATEAAFKAKVE